MRLLIHAVTMDNRITFPLIKTLNVNVIYCNLTRPTIIIFEIKSAIVCDVSRMSSLWTCLPKRYSKHVKDAIILYRYFLVLIILVFNLIKAFDSKFGLVVCVNTNAIVQPSFVPLRIIRGD
jgi:hypothetical protein